LAESVHKWEDLDVDVDPDSIRGRSQARSDSYMPDPMEVELELMLNYPLDPFAPALMWRPAPQDEWIEAQESAADSVEGEAGDLQARPSEAS